MCYICLLTVNPILSHSARRLCCFRDRTSATPPNQGAFFCEQTLRHFAGAWSSRTAVSTESMQVISAGARQVGERCGPVFFQGCAVDGAGVSCREEGTAMFRWADDAGMVRSDGMGHVSGQGGHWVYATASPGCGLCLEQADWSLGVCNSQSRLWPLS